MRRVDETPRSAAPGPTPVAAPAPAPAPTPAPAPALAPTPRSLSAAALVDSKFRLMMVWGIGLAPDPCDTVCARRTCRRDGLTLDGAEVRDALASVESVGRSRRERECSCSIIPAARLARMVVAVVCNKKKKDENKDEYTRA